MTDVAKAVADKLLGRTAALKEVHGTHHTASVLEVCTTMIPKATAYALSADDIVGSPIVKYFEYGWMVHTGSFEQDEAQELAAAGYPELAALMRFANEEGFRFLKLDCNARELPDDLGFPTFRWLTPVYTLKTAVERVADKLIGAESRCPRCHTFIQADESWEL